MITQPKLSKSDIAHINTLSENTGFKILKKIIEDEVSALEKSYRSIHSYELINSNSKKGIKTPYTADEQISLRNGTIDTYRRIINMVENPTVLMEK